MTAFVIVEFNVSDAAALAEYVSDAGPLMPACTPNATWQ